MFSDNSSITVPPDDLAYAGLTVGVSVLSFFGSLLIIVTYVIYGDLRTTSRKLLVYLSVADLLTAVGNVLGVAGFLHRFEYVDSDDAILDTWLCVFPAALTVFSTISSFSWTVCIAIFLYVCIVHNKVALADKFTWGFHVVSWILPATITFSSVGCGVLGKGSVNASWCWIKSSIGHQESVTWAFMTGPTWELLAVLLSLVFYAATKWHIRKEIKREGYISRETMSVISQANRKLTFVPIIFILLRVWGLVRFLVNFNGVNDNVVLKLLQGVGDSGQGLANMILFCFFTSKIRQHMYETVRYLVYKCIHCCSGSSPGIHGVATGTYLRGKISSRDGDVNVVVYSGHNESSRLLNTTAKRKA